MAKTTKKTAPKKALPTLVTFLLDRSGSMNSIKAATIEGFNAYLASLKQEKEASIDFTFLTFDTGSLDKVCVADPIASVVELTDAFYQPRGGTPLIDAAVKTIRATEDALKLRDSKTKVVVAIQTDGFENASTEHTSEELRGLIAARTADGWEFLFMGAGIDAYSQAQQFGIAAANTMSYDAADLASTKAAFSASAGNTRSFGNLKTMSASYSGAQKTAAGDAFWKKITTVTTAPAIVTKTETRLDLTSPVSVTAPRRRKTVPDFSL